ncbi:MAG: PQQ-dependent sugar dehydrogenase, partial [Candidatus Latescibacteria bacterium]|nr:PQQ-dependent sugar dehydrogenase [Candidatus Latescibacterota bacterium]
MKKSSVGFVGGVLCLFACGNNPQSPDPEPDKGPEVVPTETIPGVNRGGFKIRTLVGDLNTPWDLVLASDGKLWITQRNGTVTVVDTSSGLAQEVGTISGVLERGESGLMGMALHPDFPANSSIYFAHSYDGGGGSVKNRLVRAGFDGFQLHSQETLLDDIPGSFNHNGSRLLIGPDRLLYMTTGDAEGPNRAIDLNSLAGKLLRLDLDGRAAPGNPFATEIFSFGHRNPQGLAFAPSTNTLYATEHGPSSNDEINLILVGRNHGWPEVHGYCHDEDVFGGAEAQFCRENDVNEPIAVWTPTIAPAGAEFYTSTSIPGWNGSLLLVTLKDQALYRITLGSEGGRAVGQEVLFQGEFGRVRDVA